MPKFNLIIFFIILLNVTPVFGYAETPFEERTINYFLKEQLEKDSSHRFIPKNDYYSFVADINIWKYWVDTSSYYHGPGYWADTYLEVRPFSDLRANLRTVFVNGSTSYGYNNASSIRTILGVTWTPDILPSGFNFMMRFFDLDRETLGAGLFFEDREMSGLLLQIDSNKNYFKLRLPGTSVLQRGGDLWSAEFFRKSSSNEIGVHTFFIDGYNYQVPQATTPPTYLTLEDNLGLTSSIFLRSSPNRREGGTYRLETAFHDSKISYLASVGYQQLENCSTCWSIRGQYRHYSAGMLDRLSGNMEYDFVPYSFMERGYQNAQNIFVVDDEIQTYGVIGNLKLKIGSNWVFESMNELSQFDYKNINSSDNFKYFSTQRFGYCPYKDFQKNCLYFYYSNKVIRALSTNGYGIYNEPILRDEPTLGIYGVFYL